MLADRMRRLPEYPLPMELVQIDSLPRYLEPSAEADFHDPAIQSLLDMSGWSDLTPVEQARAVFLYVRDEIPHAWDIQAERVTCAASHVLRERTGLCYAKSHLVAALLRALGVPTGYCYQKLVLFDDPADGYSLHGLNAAYLEGCWVRFDTRGNKPGIDAQFSLEKERLAFRVRPEMGEIDYPGVYAEADRGVVRRLREATDARDLYRRGLPADLSRLDL